MKKGIFHLLIIYTILFSSFPVPLVGASTFSPSPNVPITTSPNHTIYLPIVQTPLLPPIIPNSTKVLPLDTTQYLANVSTDGSTYTFNHDTSDLDQLQPGSVIVSGITTNAPNGILRKVVSVNKIGGQVDVNTTQAVLTDAIEQGSLRVDETLTPSQVVSPQTLPGVNLRPQSVNDSIFHIDLSNVVLYDADGNLNTTNDQIVIHSGNIDLSSSYHLEADIQKNKITDALITGTIVGTSHIPVNANVTLDLNTKKMEKNIAKFPMGAIMVPIGPVLIPVAAVLEINVGITGEVSAGISLDTTQTTTLTVGGKYSGGQWSPVQNCTNQFSFSNPQVSGSVAAKVYAGPQIDLMLFGVAGPALGLNLYAKVEQDVTPVTYGDLAVGEEGTLTIATVADSIFDLVNPSLSWTVGEFVLKKWGPDRIPNVPSNSSPPDGVTGLNSNVMLVWTGGDPYNDPVTYAIYLDPNTATPTTVISTDQSGTTFQLSSLTTNTHYYWQVVAKDDQGNAVPGPIWSFTTGSGSSQSPTVDVKVNGSDGPVNLTTQDTFTVSWTSTNASSCNGSGTMVGQSGLSGNYTDGPKAVGNYTYTISCSNGSANVLDSVALNIAAPVTSSTGRIAAGDTHTCALTTSSGVKCWGDNYYGELGDGTQNQRLTPVNVVGLTDGVAAIAAGYNHTCALTISGGVKCWGDNYYGELGDGTQIQRLTPVDVIGLSSVVTAVSAGDHTCALTSLGGVKCWGDNQYGQLGDGTGVNRSTPVDVVGLSSGVVAITAGAWSTCALTLSGGVKCWGYNWYGGLGDGTAASRLTPVDVVGLTGGVAAITAGYDHTCALTISGGVKCWGWNLYGELGDGTNNTSEIPVDVTGLSSGVALIAAGHTHTCAVTIAGGVKCWGNNWTGALGDGTTTLRLTPVDVIGLSVGISDIVTGSDFTCTLTTNNGVKCWGSGAELGDGIAISSSIPVDVIGFP